MEKWNLSGLSYGPLLACGFLLATGQCSSEMSCLFFSLSCPLDGQIRDHLFLSVGIASQVGSQISNHWLTPVVCLKVQVYTPAADRFSDP